jgi:hypothetical protein
MKTRSLILYLFVTAINIFLFLPVLFNPVIIAPLHILVFILSYDWLLKKESFKSGWNKILFSSIPGIGQILLVLILFIADSNHIPGIVSLVQNFIFILLVLLSIVEIAILAMQYSKYLARRQKQEEMKSD